MRVFIDKYPEDDDKERVVEVELHEYDTWNMDDTLAIIILPLLKQIKQDKQGAPNVDNEDVPEQLRMPEGWYEERYSRNGETDPNFFHRWDWVLDEMIFAFDSYFNDWQEKYYTKSETPMKWIPAENAEEQLLLFPEEDGETSEFSMYQLESSGLEMDMKGYTKEQERISNGLRLFGKYYQSLWT